MNNHNRLKSKKYLISGIGPGDDGVGRLMKVLVPEAESKGFKVFYKLTNIAKKNTENRFRRIKNLIDEVNILIREISLNLNISLASNAKILIIHPQTVGFYIIFKIAKKNKLYLYLMDNSFFCIRSYNINPNDNNECLQCIGNPTKAHRECTPWPVQHDRDDAIVNLRKLMDLSKDIIFLVQNKLQEKLVKKHFGEVETIVVGLKIIEFKDGNLNYLEKKEKSSNKIVYHGATHYAKGVEYFINLAIQTPELEFIIPDAKEVVEKYIGKKIDSDNIIFIPCTWETGLKKLVSDAAIVINPSLWSAPIEGALLKSIVFNGAVATVKTQYGYESEICENYPILRLSQDLKEAKEQILMHLQYLKSKKTALNNKAINLDILTLSLINPLDAIK